MRLGGSADPGSDSLGSASPLEGFRNKNGRAARRSAAVAESVSSSARACGLAALAALAPYRLCSSNTTVLKSSGLKEREAEIIHGYRFVASCDQVLDLIL